MNEEEKREESYLKIKLKNGLTIDCLTEPYVLIEREITSEEDQGLSLIVSDQVKKYDRLCYTTGLDTMKLIFERKTLRCSSLTYANLNDRMERERVGVSQYAGGRFICCFSHASHESVPFWMYYGIGEKKNKVLLKFNNFSKTLNESIFIDYCLLNEGKRMFFYSDDYERTAKHNCIMGQHLGLPKINEDFEIDNYISCIEMLDVEYLPSDDEAFVKDYSGIAEVDFGEYLIDEDKKKQLECFLPDCLGRQKSLPWSYEEESRILCCLNQQDSSKWDFIDLRLKDKIFKDLIIVMNPWADKELENKIIEIIEDSTLDEKVKSSIRIIHSELEGTINM